MLLPKIFTKWTQLKVFKIGLSRHQTTQGHGMIKEVLPVTPYLKKEKRFCPLNGANTFLIPLTFLVSFWF